MIGKRTNRGSRGESQQLTEILPDARAYRPRGPRDHNPSNSRSLAPFRDNAGLATQGTRDFFD